MLMKQMHASCCAWISVSRGTASFILLCSWFCRLLTFSSRSLLGLARALVRPGSLASSAHPSPAASCCPQVLLGALKLAVPALQGPCVAEGGRPRLLRALEIAKTLASLKVCKSSALPFLHAPAPPALPVASPLSHALVPALPSCCG